MSGYFDQYRSALTGHCPAATVRPEQPGDQAFLRQLFVACSPLSGILPDQMVQQQAALQAASYRTTFPAAMAVIAEVDMLPAGRLLIAWDQNGCSACVDIAVLPQRQSAGLGGSMLRAWIEVADSLGQPCTLEVQPDNPARALYHRLGFREAAPSDHYQVSIPMIRACSGPGI
jgi:ribosomal protein S18 acetylase RimI-like enzyme